MGKVQVVMPFGHTYKIVLCAAQCTSDRPCWAL